MTAPLHDLLDEVADDVARVAPAVDPRALWAAGRRRRRTRRVHGMAGGLAVVLLAVLLVPVGVVRSPAQWAGPSADAVSDHPARIGEQWWVRPLPDRPGPLALLVQGRPAFPQPWYGVSPDGTRWRLTDVAHRTDQFPTLSPDGRLLGYLSDEDGPYVLHDLVTGERRPVDGVSDNRAEAPGRHQLTGQSPTHWAPDGSRVMLPTLDPVLLDVGSGRLTAVARPVGSVTPAGFAGPDRFVWLRAGGPRGLLGAVDAVVTDLAGAVQRTVPLTPGKDLQGVSQWSGVVSPDGRQLAVVNAGQVPDAGTIVRHDLESGAAQGPEVPAVVEPTCPSAWGERLVVPAGAASGAAESHELVLAVEQDRAETLVVVEDRDELRCAVWASAALTAGGGRGLLGTSSSWLSWWWPELLTGSLLLAVLRLGARAARTRRGSTLS